MSKPGPDDGSIEEALGRCDAALRESKEHLDAFYAGVAAWEAERRSPVHIAGKPPSTGHGCPVCGREWFVGAITPVEPESVFARVGRWLRSVAR